MDETASHHPDLSALSSPEEKHWQGIAVSPGIAIAPAYLFTRYSPKTKRITVPEALIEAEILRFEEALSRSEYELQKIATVAQEKIGSDSAAIFEAQTLMVRDETLSKPVIERIIRDSCNAEFAVQLVMERHISSLESSENQYLRERAQDFRDVQDRIIRNLQRRRLLSQIDEDRVVIAHSLTAADVVLFSRRHIKGCVMDYGGATSHASIMARALEIPVIVSVGWACSEIEDQSFLILDGFTGLVIQNPTEKTLAHYRAKQAHFTEIRANQHKWLPLPSETPDGHSILLQANIEVKQELSLMRENGAKGIGLLRTEMIFLMDGKPLNEDEQFHFYKEVIQTASPYPTTIRLLDLGGDKVMPMAHHEPNPFLGWRGVRILLDRPELLKPQIRAILRASVFGKVNILIPMITNVTEVRAIKRFIAKMEDELAAENVPFVENVAVGIMVEVPAVAMMAESFAQEADFFSIGTNDLTQYTLAIDRGNDLVGKHYDELHPAILQLVARTIEAAKSAHIPVSICGEAAADPFSAVLFMGLGVDSLSASSVFLPEMKRIIRSVTMLNAQKWAKDALLQPDARVLRKRIFKMMREEGIDTEQFLSLVE